MGSVLFPAGDALGSSCRDLTGCSGISVLLQSPVAVQIHVCKPLAKKDLRCVPLSSEQDTEDMFKTENDSSFR